MGCGSAIVFGMWGAIAFYLIAIGNFEVIGSLLFDSDRLLSFVIVKAIRYGISSGLIPRDLR